VLLPFKLLCAHDAEFTLTSNEDSEEGGIIKVPEGVVRGIMTTMMSVTAKKKTLTTEVGSYHLRGIKDSHDGAGNSVGETASVSLPYFLEREMISPKENTTSDQTNSNAVNRSRQLEGADSSLSKVVETLLDTPPDEWDAKQMLTFVILIIASLVLGVCLCCMCCLLRCCGAKSGSSSNSFCKDLLLMFCCYELFCGSSNDCCGDGVINGDYINGWDAEMV